MTQIDELPDFEEIAEVMACLPDLDAKFQYLIDLSKRLPEFNDVDRIDDYRVWGCQSSVWLVPTLDKSATPPVLRFCGTSDSVLVSGIIAIVLSLHSGRTPEEILRLDAPEELNRLDLKSHLSHGRQNGLAGMLEQIRKHAADLVVGT
ncbi:MAG: SufE family protein [Verrucomicrobiota bacterium]